MRCIYKQTPEEEGLFKFHAKRSHAPSLSSGPLQTWIKTSESARSSQPDSWTIHDSKRAEKVRTVDSMVTGSGFQWAESGRVFCRPGGSADRTLPHFLASVWSEDGRKYSCRSIIHKGPESHDYTFGVFITH